MKKDSVDLLDKHVSPKEESFSSRWRNEDAGFKGLAGAMLISLVVTTFLVFSRLGFQTLKGDLNLINTTQFFDALVNSNTTFYLVLVFLVLALISYCITRADLILRPLVANFFRNGKTKLVPDNSCIIPEYRKHSLSKEGRLGLTVFVNYTSDFEQDEILPVLPKTVAQRRLEYSFSRFDNNNKTVSRNIKQADILLMIVGKEWENVSDQYQTALKLKRPIMFMEKEGAVLPDEASTFRAKTPASGVSSFQEITEVTHQFENYIHTKWTTHSDKKVA